MIASNLMHVRKGVCESLPPIIRIDIMSLAGDSVRPDRDYSGMQLLLVVTCWRHIEKLLHALRELGSLESKSEHNLKSKTS